MNTRTGLFVLLTAAALASHANTFQITAMGGVIVPKLSSNELVAIDPSVTNRYETDEDFETGPLLGLGLQYVFTGLARDSLDFSLGLSTYYLNYGYLTGTESPMFNDGDFPPLNYLFKVKSYALLLEPKLIYTKSFWQPYLVAGVGSSWNRAYNYHEKPMDPDGSAAAAAPFKSRTLTEFAYELGVGVQVEFDRRPENHLKYLFSAEYRYMNLGQAELGPRTGQSTDESLEVNPLSTQALVFSISAVF